MCTLSCDTLWNSATKQYEPNPYGDTVPSLYIGTEMDLFTEIEPIILSTISGVEEDKIKTYDLTEEEEERLNKAKEISKRSPIYLENEPNYCVDFFWDMAEAYTTKYNIGALIVDYIEMTPALASEFAQMTRGMQVREDQVLFNLSTQLKNISKVYDLFVKAYTQVSDNARRDYRLRDSGAIKGSKSLQMRADLGLCTFAPTKEELEIMKDYMEENKIMTPNIIIHVYKNRGGKLVNVKIWGYQNLGTMQFIELFVTDWNYKVISVGRTYLRKLETELENDTGVEQVEPKHTQEVVQDLSDDSFGGNCHIVEDDELPLEFDPETGEIIEQPKKTTRVSRRKR